MKYAKLINNFPQWAPNPIIYNGNRIGNPPDKLLVSLGYKPVQFNDPPEPISETGWWTPVWTEDEEKIFQGWSWYEPEEDE